MSATRRNCPHLCGVIREAVQQAQGVVNHRLGDIRSSLQVFSMMFDRSDLGETQCGQPMDWIVFVGNVHERASCTPPSTNMDANLRWVIICHATSRASRCSSECCDEDT